MPKPLMYPERIVVALPEGYSAELAELFKLPTAAAARAAIAYGMSHRRRLALAAKGAPKLKRKYR